MKNSMIQCNKFWLLFVVWAAIVPALNSEASEVDIYLDSIPHTNRSRIVQTVFVAPEVRGTPVAQVAPDASVLSIYHYRNASELPRLSFVSIGEGKVLAEILAESGRGTTIVPAEATWSPDAQRVFVRMKYTDIDYGEWCEYDLAK